MALLKLGVVEALALAFVSFLVGTALEIDGLLALSLLRCCGLDKDDG